MPRKSTRICEISGYLAVPRSPSKKSDRSPSQLIYSQVVLLRKVFVAAIERLSASSIQRLYISQETVNGANLDPKRLLLGR